MVQMKEIQDWDEKCAPELGLKMCTKTGFKNVYQNWIEDAYQNWD
jgi:hypothetical protein